MFYMNTVLDRMDDLQAFSLMQTYILKQGINKFRENGISAAHKDMQQLHN